MHRFFKILILYQSVTLCLTARRSFVQSRSFNKDSVVSYGKPKTPVVPISEVGVLPRSFPLAMPAISEAQMQPAAKSQAPPAPSAPPVPSAPPPEGGPQRKALGKRPNVPPPLPPQSLPKQLSSSAQWAQLAFAFTLIYYRLWFGKLSWWCGVHIMLSCL